MSRGVGLNHSARARGGGREPRGGARPEPPPAAPRAPPLTRHAPLDSPASGRRTHVHTQGHTHVLGCPRTPPPTGSGDPGKPCGGKPERPGGDKFKSQLRRLALLCFFSFPYISFSFPFPSLFCFSEFFLFPFSIFSFVFLFLFLTFLAYLFIVYLLTYLGFFFFETG